ncbi:DUF4148 domain-containing protein [Caballeronia sp. 15711]|uniref:DUF4148 domain-containing protein n=2 Tax=unclassified Caballeronia TaxID=2646786 RepID=UPI0039E6BED5
MPANKNVLHYYHRSQEHEMTRLFFTSAVLAVAIVFPAFAIAQDNGAPTRAAVKADFIQFKQAGFDPTANDQVDYPESLQRAQQKLAAQRQTESTSYGASTSGTSTSGD